MGRASNFISSAFNFHTGICEVSHVKGKKTCKREENHEPLLFFQELFCAFVARISPS